MKTAPSDPKFPAHAPNPCRRRPLRLRDHNTKNAIKSSDGVSCEESITKTVADNRGSERAVLSDLEPYASIARNRSSHHPWETYRFFGSGGIQVDARNATIASLSGRVATNAKRTRSKRSAWPAATRDCVPWRGLKSALAPIRFPEDLEILAWSRSASWMEPSLPVPFGCRSDISIPYRRLAPVR